MRHKKFLSLASRTKQLIYIDPRKIKTIVERNSGDGEEKVKRKHSGLVISGYWERNAYPIDTHSEINICHLHFT